MNTEQLRKRLLQYPGATEELIEEQLSIYEKREELKSHLIQERGMSNALAEVYLDKKGYSRPPGWHSVFFYPDSWRPRNKIIFYLVIIGIIIYFLI